MKYRQKVCRVLAEFQYDKDAKVKMLHKSILASRQSGKVLNSKLNARLVQITFKQCNGTRKSCWSITESKIELTFCILHFNGLELLTNCSTVYTTALWRVELVKDWVAKGQSTCLQILHIFPILDNITQPLFIIVQKKLISTTVESRVLAHLI